MRIEIHPRLVEESVFLALRAGEGGPAVAEAAAWLRRALDRGYLLPAGSFARARRFERAHAAVFGRLGLASALRRICDAHPALALAEGGVRLGPAPGPGKEGFDLHERTERDGSAARTVLGSLLPESAADPARAARTLHRQAMQVADLLDPAYGWRSGDAEPTPAARERVRVRYGALWDAWTDGRLRRRGLPAPAGPEEGRRAFGEAVATVLSPAEAAAAFAFLDGAGALVHGDLLGWARDLRTLPGAGGKAGAPRREGFLPGASCPLCRFPTHDWVADPAALPEGVLAAARVSRPGWVPAEGLCGQCALLYRGRLPARERGKCIIV